MTLPKNTPGELCVNTVFHILQALQRSTPFLTVKHGGNKFNFPWPTIIEMAGIFVPLVVKVGNGKFPADGNHLLHTVDHFRQILL